jgi:uncharacterized protein
MEIASVLEIFREKIALLYGDRLHAVVLYGSCARRQATPESDIDVAVVLADEVAPSREIDRMIDIITETNLEYGVLLSVYPVSRRDYDDRNAPLLANIRKEGVRA